MRSAAVPCAFLALALAGCGNDGGGHADGRCVLGEEAGTALTRVSDCQFELEDGTRVRMVLVRHLHPEGGTLEVDIDSFRLFPDGSIERLSTEEGSELLAPATD